MLDESPQIRFNKINQIGNLPRSQPYNFFLYFNILNEKQMPTIQKYALLVKGTQVTSPSIAGSYIKNRERFPSWAGAIPVRNSL